MFHSQQNILLPVPVPSRTRTKSFSEPKQFLNLRRNFTNLRRSFINLRRNFTNLRRKTKNTPERKHVFTRVRTTFLSKENKFSLIHIKRMLYTLLYIYAREALFE